MVMTFSRIRRNRAPSETSLIFDVPSRGATDRLEAHAVAGLDERQRRRGRRRESVRQQMEELAEPARARRPEARREIGNVPAGEVAGQPVQHALPA